MRRVRHLGLVALVLLASLALAVPAGAVAIDQPAFASTWARTDKPVVDHQVNRTWMWGPEPFSPTLSEPYAEGPDGHRQVQYFDKSRMEITHPGDDSSSIWYVTNGLLVVELMTGELQVGDHQTEPHSPAVVNVAGDSDDANGPTYAGLAGLRGAAPVADGAAITQKVDRAGNVTTDAGLAGQGVTAAYHVSVPGIDHQVASPFWDFMNSSGLVSEGGQTTTAALFPNPFYATGYPVTEAYWATVKVAGSAKTVLIQCFERRCLTYTPDNPDGWKVEAGNVGQHYYHWRYDTLAGPPTEGAIIAQSNLTDFPPFENPDSNLGHPTAGGYELSAQPGSAAVLVSSEPAIGDASFAVSMRQLDPASDVASCLLLRVGDPINGNRPLYALCLLYTGGQTFSAAVIAQSVDGDGQANSDIIALYPFDPTLPSDGWNTVKVIAKGHQFWFYVNDVYLGTETHDGPLTGGVGLLAENEDAEQPANVEYTNMVVKALAPS